MRHATVLLTAVCLTMGIAGLAGAEPIPPAGMVLVPAGSFSMGGEFYDGRGGSDEQPVRGVFVNAFFMDEYEVTKKLWDEVAAWAQSNGYDFSLSSGSGKDQDHPVYYVSWAEALQWANARSEREGLPPCYTVSGNVYRTGESASVVCNWSVNGYRLPTEAEWEKAARGGVAGRRFPWSDVNTIDHTRANYCSTTDYGYDTSATLGFHPGYDTGEYPYTSPVGSFAPNGYGLYDMAGNVWEWCWDWYEKSYYASSERDNPHGPALGVYRVIRGGSWHYYADRCRVAWRSSYWPALRTLDLGFRLVRTTE